MNADCLFALYDRVADAPNAVGRLRRFVLDIAVRGKLVQQNPADEPSSELLERIAVEKARLLEAREIRKPRAVAPLNENGLPFSLPTGWEWTQIAQLGVLSPRNEAPDDHQASFVPMKLIAAEYGVGHLHETRPWADIGKGYTHFAEGDVGLAKITPCFENGKSTVFRNLTGGIGSGTTELHVVRPLFVTGDYIVLFLKSSYFIETGILRMTGTAGQKRVPTEYFASSPFPLPPLAEQRRIVAKVDELMALCDRLEETRAAREDTRDRLTKASYARLSDTETDASTFRSHARSTVDALPTLTARADQVKHLRQTVLDLAVRGKLVEQDSTEEPASELLKRIAEVKGKLGVKHDVKPLGTNEAPFRLPSGWRWSRIGELCTKTGSGSTPRGGKSVYKTNGVPFLRSQNVYDDGLRLANVAYIGGDVHARMAGTAVRAGDLLLNITGGSMGRCCRVPDGFAEANVSQHVAIIRAAVPEMADYVHKLVLSPYFQAFIFRGQTGAGRGGLPKNRMDRIAVALPPLAEQHRIVATVDALMALCDQLEAGLDATDGTRHRLLESLLQDTLTPSAYEAATAGAVGA